MRLLRGRRAATWRPTQFKRRDGHRIGVIGASHMAALQRAASDGHRPEGVDLTFRGLGGREFFAIRAGEDGLFVDTQRLVLNDTMRRRTWGRLDAIVRYDQFDAFIVVGVMRTRFLVGSVARNGLHTYSPSYIRAGFEAAAERDHGFHLAGEIARRGWPVAVTASPLPAEPRALKSDWEGPYRTVMQLLSDAADKRGVAFVPQPEETLERFAWTQPRYAMAPSGLTGASTR